MIDLLDGSTLRSDKVISNEPHITILGAGPAGALMSILLAQQGRRVVAYERLPDLRHNTGVAGRSINLALADRGIHALKQAGLFPTIEPLLMPMRGRMLHDQSGQQTLLPYGHEPHEVIYSISRARLTAALLDHAERQHHVEFRFRQTGISVDATQRRLCMQDIPTGKLYSIPLDRVIGSDGAGSILRRFVIESLGADCREEMLTHGYKELNIAADQMGNHRLDPAALHVWPRGEFMLIALPNVDGTFTSTLFMPHDGPISFASLTRTGEIRSFFAQHFKDALELMPDIETQFAVHPTGSMGTVHLDRWHFDEHLLLIGDAAHAIVPFHGQGMNCAFEDCIQLDTLLRAHHDDWKTAFAQFQIQRQPNCDAIAEMALENYVEMRDTVRNPRFLLQKALSLELERRFPHRFIPRYSMVMFHHEIPYATALERGRIQNEILEALTVSAKSTMEIDYADAERLIMSRLPLIQ